MTAPELLGPLAALHQMMRDLLRQVSAEDAAARPLDGRPSLAWTFARAVYVETCWLREMLAGDADLTDRVRHLLEPGALPLAEQCAQLPPPEHLLHWAAEIHDEHLRRLATPAALPASPLLAGGRLPWLVLQENAKAYERMLALRLALVLTRDEHRRSYRVDTPLTAAAPGWELIPIEQGHYRIGSRQESFAYDNELPPQAVELSAYRIAATPVTNAQYLAFMDAGGYADADLWPEEAEFAERDAPLHWRRDADGNWYAVGLNGAADLPPDDPVAGIDQHEARAYARWAAAQDPALGGAVLQHEYQWEVAARAGHLRQTGRVWEWCSNPFHAYPGFEPFPDAGVSGHAFGSGAVTLKGASLHTQPCLRRASFRHWAAPGDAMLVAGARLVLPPA